MLALAITHRRRGATARDAAFYAAAEHEACADVVARGVLKALLLRTDGRGVVMVLEPNSADRLHAFLDRLPMMESGVSAYDLLGVVPVAGFPVVPAR